MVGAISPLLLVLSFLLFECMHALSLLKARCIMQQPADDNSEMRGKRKKVEREVKSALFVRDHSICHNSDELRLDQMIKNIEVFFSMVNPGLLCHYFL